MSDTFTSRSGSTWTRHWVGDNAGRYEWTTDDKLAVCWRDSHQYRARVRGRVLDRSYLTLLDAMQAAEAAAVTRAA